LTLFFVLTFTFLLTFSIPTDPARAVVGPKGTAEQVATVRENLGLDDPLPAQYARYMGRALTGDLGYSYSQRRAVSDLIAERLPYTALLALGALVVQVGLGVSVGVLAASRAGGAFDRSALAAALLVISLPGFWVGLVLLYLLAYRLPVFPLGGNDFPLGLVLPSLALGIAGAAWYSRITREAIVDILNTDMVRALRAKGMPPRTILLKHSLRAAAGPVITMLAIDFGFLLGGAVVIETVFSWPGLGLTAYQAMQRNDVPLLMGCVIVGSLFVLVLNTVADVARAFLDPRVRL